MELFEELGIRELRNGESIEILIPKELIERSKANIKKGR